MISPLTVAAREAMAYAQAYRARILRTPSPLDASERLQRRAARPAARSRRGVPFRRRTTPPPDALDPRRAQSSVTTASIIAPIAATATGSRRRLEPRKRIVRCRRSVTVQLIV